MNKRTTVWISIIVLVFLLIFPVRKLFVIEDDKNPGFISSYGPSGYYTFDPKTILASIERGEADVFTPFVGNPDEITLEDLSIDWTQMDYLKITNLLSQQIWNESLDLEGWDVYSIYFQSECKDNPQGFNEFSIVYYKALGVKNWERRYTVRLVDIFPWQGLIRWGGDSDFSVPLLSAWDNIDLLKFKITPLDAMQIADKNGGKEARLHVGDVCTISVSMFQQDDGMWEVAYPQAYFRMSVNSNTGAYKVQYVGQ